jgi:hypothetical protein
VTLPTAAAYLVGLLEPMEDGRLEILALEIFSEPEPTINRHGKWRMVVIDQTVGQTFEEAKSRLREQTRVVYPWIYEKIISR